MALFLFAEAMMKNEPINVFGNGEMMRDFTYVGDIVLSISKLLVKPPKERENWDAKNTSSETSSAPYSIYNIGNNSPVGLMEYIKAIEVALDKESVKNYMGMQPGDVRATYANVDDLYDYIDFKPETTVQEGINKFIEWYKVYYNIK
jgi:UDP-glucuronate 4-epimerase